ncbi:MAG: hypothetical protein ACI4U2_01405 [Christensenellaceae bacterium]
MTIGIGNRGVEIGDKLYPWEMFVHGEYKTFVQEVPLQITQGVLRDWRVFLHTQSGQEISIARNYTVYLLLKRYCPIEIENSVVLDQAYRIERYIR